MLYITELNFYFLSSGNEVALKTSLCFVKTGAFKDGITKKGAWNRLKR